MISVEIATKSGDLQAIATFFRALAAWDASQAAAYGIPPETILEFFHSDADEDQVAKFTGSETRLFIAKWDGVAAGCVAFDRFDGKRLELHRVFVDPAFRGKGIGRALIAAALAEAKKTGQEMILVQTGLFMQVAIALYEAAGFTRCPPFREVPEAIVHSEVFMSRPL